MPDLDHTTIVYILQLERKLAVTTLALKLFVQYSLNNPTVKQTSIYAKSLEEDESIIIEALALVIETCNELRDTAKRE